MLSKRVHFASTNTVYSPVPETPSPALSHTSLPSDSSSELSTPPPEIDYSPAHYPRSPFPQTTDLIIHPQQHHLQQTHYQSLQQQSSLHSHDVALKPVLEPTHMQIHYLLAYSPAAEVPIYFDLSRHWSQVAERVQAHELTEPATNPPLTALVITCPLLPWRLHITSPVPGAIVTVQDVLISLFRQLRLTVHPDEYNATDVSSTRIAVDAAYHSRWSRVLDIHAKEIERKKGVKKIDFLQGRNIFRGLSGTLAGAEIWELNVSA